MNKFVPVGSDASIEIVCVPELKSAVYGVVKPLPSTQNSALPEG
jgi:hypothetical protein